MKESFLCLSLEFHNKSIIEIYFDGEIKSVGFILKMKSILRQELNVTNI